jgi:hypothetical protein
MNKFSLVAAAALTVATFGVTAAFAEGTDDFAMADGNKDKVVSYDEARGAFPTLAQSIFDQADANKDGSLDEAEFGSLKGLTAANGGSGGTSSDDNSSSADTSSSNDSSSSASTAP